MAHVDATTTIVVVGGVAFTASFIPMSWHFRRFRRCASIGSNTEDLIAARRHANMAFRWMAVLFAITVITLLCGWVAQRGFG